MTTLKFEFSLDSSDPHGLVRIWLDSNRDATLSDEEELEVKMDGDARKFTAEKEVADDKVNGMFFRAKYFLTPDLKWTMKATAGDKPCYEAANTVKHTVSGMSGHVEVTS